MGDSDKLGAGHECDNWEIRVKTPTPGLEGLTGGLESGTENMKLSPRVGGDREEERGETINMDECWTKAPASLSIDTGDPDEEGFAETVISECEGEKGNFLCGPEWKVKITTKADQRLDVQQIQDGDDFRVLISPLPPIKEEKEEVASVKSEKKVQKKEKVEKKVVKIEVKSNGMDNRYLTSGGKIFFKECPLYHKAHPWVMPLGLS